MRTNDGFRPGVGVRTLPEALRERGYVTAAFIRKRITRNLASIAEREGHDEEARTMLGEAVQLNAADADAWNRLGLVEARRGAAAAARTAFAPAITAAPERAEPYDNLAIVERQAGNEQLAQARLQDAVSRNPGYAKVQYELGTGYLLARDPARALDCYRGALGASGLRRSAVRGCASRPRSGARRRRTALVRRIHPHRTAGVSPADRGRARSPSPAALTRVLSGCPITLVAHFALPASN